MGSRGDDYDNTMAEACNSLYKAERIRNPMMRPYGGWKSILEVELVVIQYIESFNHRRLHDEFGWVPPAEFATNHWAGLTPESNPQEPATTGAGPN